MKILLAVKMYFLYRGIKGVSVNIQGAEKAMSDIEARVFEIISQQFRIDKSKISVENSLVEDLGADSLDIVELIMAMEAEFNIDIPDEDVESFSAVSDVIEYIRKHQV
ncbi:MAG: hypothetical protein Kow0090_07590 [Myxococcota bacterium]